jgi:hypothetical protein
VRHALPCRRVSLVLERNNAVELRPSMENMFEAVRKVCEDVMAITENLPRLVLLGTARQLKELEVSAQVLHHCTLAQPVVGWSPHAALTAQPEFYLSYLGLVLLLCRTGTGQHHNPHMCICLFLRPITPLFC